MVFVAVLYVGASKAWRQKTGSSCLGPVAELMYFRYKLILILNLNITKTVVFKNFYKNLRFIYFKVKRHPKRTSLDVYSF